MTLFRISQTALPKPLDLPLCQFSIIYQHHLNPSFWSTFTAPFGIYETQRALLKALYCFICVIMIGVNSIHSIGRLRSRSLCSVRCGRDFSVMDPFRYTKAPRSRSLKPLDFPDLLGKVQDGQNHPQTRKKKEKVTFAGNFTRIRECGKGSFFPWGLGYKIILKENDCNCKNLFLVHGYW